MATYTNQSGGTVILPDGTEIKAGGSADISGDAAKNVGVSQMIEGSMLVAVKQASKPKTKRPDDD